MSGERVWPKPSRSHASRTRYRYVVQRLGVGSAPWSDIESFRWRWLAIFYAMWLKGGAQVIDSAVPVSSSFTEGKN